MKSQSEKILSKMSNLMTKHYTMTFDVVKGNRKKSYEKFESLFLAYANVYGFGDIVKGTPVPVIGEWDTEEEKKTYDANTKGYSALLHACRNHHEAFTVVNKAKGEDYPDGNLQEALEELKTRFSDDAKLKKKKLENNFNSKKKIKATENPVTILEGLFDLKENLTKFDVIKTDEEVFEKLLERLPKEYRMEAAVLKYALNGGTLNQERIIQELTIKFEELNPDDSDEEITDDSEDSSDDKEALIGETLKAKKSKIRQRG